MNPPLNQIIQGDSLSVLKTFPDECVDMAMFSPPYFGLRNYGVEGQMGLEPTFGEFLDKLMAVMKEVKRVLKPSGTIWVNFGDCYGTAHLAGTTDKEMGWQQDKGLSKNEDRGRVFGIEKSLLMQPGRFAIRCVDELGLILRNKIKWAKQILVFGDKKYTMGSVMPTSVKDRFNESGEELFFFTKSSTTQFWRHKITKEEVRKQPLGIHGIEGKDWEWRDCYDKTLDCKKCNGMGRKKVSLWLGCDYWYDLDAVRLPPQTFENRPMGINREKEYPNAKRNKFAFNYRVRDAERKSGQPQFKASEEEIKNYKQVAKDYGKKKKGIEQQGNRWMSGTPNFTYRQDIRAKEAQKEGMHTFYTHSGRFKKQDNVPSRNAQTYAGFNERWKQRGKFNKEIQNAQPNQRSHFQVGKALHDYYKEKGIPENNPLGKNLPTIWQINPEPHNFQRELGVESEHFAVYPQDLCEIPIKFGCPPGGIVLDPFCGSGTTCLVARNLGRNYIGIDLSKEYCQMAERRLGQKVLFNPQLKENRV